MGRVVGIIVWNVQWERGLWHIFMMTSQHMMTFVHAESTGQSEHVQTSSEAKKRTLPNSITYFQPCYFRWNSDQRCFKQPQTFDFDWWFADKSHGRLVAAGGECNVRSGLRLSPMEAVVELGIERGALMCVLQRWWGAYGWGHHAWVEGMLGSLIKSRVLYFLAHGSQVIITQFLYLLSSPTAETQGYARMSLILSLNHYSS